MKFDFSELLANEVDGMEAALLYSITYGSNVLLDALTGHKRERPTPPDRTEYIRSYVASKKEERRLDREVGPKLGPGRAEYRLARTPFENYNRIRATMPGKTMGAFRRAA